MRFLRNKPIQTKVTTVILITCSVTLLVAAAASLGLQVWAFGQRFTHDLASIVQIISKYACFTIILKDKARAEELLEALKVKSHIVGAGILLLDGSSFATYEHPTARAEVPLPPPKPGPVFEGRYLIYFELLKDPTDDSKIGWIYVRADYNGEFWTLFIVYVGVVVLVLLLSLVLALVLSSRLQRVISLPILRLAITAKSVAENKDYSVRADKLEKDEIGLFTEAFNQMLEQIENQDLELRASRQKIESLVNSIEGVVWEAHPETLQYAFVSEQAERFLGYPADEWVQNANFWRDHLYPADRDKAMHLTLDAIHEHRGSTIEYRMIAKDSSIVWVRSYASVVVDKGRPSLMRGVLLDITKEKAAADELQSLHSELLQTSRLAGMAEVATGVLHNVGNVLNSVSVSATLVRDRLRQSQVANLRRATTMLREQDGQLPEFLTQDPKGKMLPEYLGTVADQLVADQTDLISEMSSLGEHIEHIKEIVAMQQSYAKVSGAYENLSAASLVEDALRINIALFDRHRIQVLRDFDEQTREVCVDRHKVLQILINLFRNAMQASDEHKPSDKRLIVRVGPASPDRVKIVVCDNGIGIPSENLIKIFNHGFTTKKGGHGFGLHSGANAAREMGGSLTAQSDGVNQGATFTLLLPSVPGVDRKEVAPTKVTG